MNDLWWQAYFINNQKDEYGDWKNGDSDRIERVNDIYDRYQANIKKTRQYQRALEKARKTGNYHELGRMKFSRRQYMGLNGG